MKKILENKFIRLFSFKRRSKTFLISCFLISFFIFDLTRAESNNLNTNKKAEIAIDNLDPKRVSEEYNRDSKTIELTLENEKNRTEIGIDYLDARNELEDYIIDTGDKLFIEFYPSLNFSSEYVVSEEGEILLPRLYETYVRGLTTYELQKLLEKRYLEFLLEPVIKIRISEFKSMRVLVRGEVRDPGLYKFPSYRSKISLNLGTKEPLRTIDLNEIESSNKSLFKSIKRKSDNVITISDVIRKAGGITSSSDLTKIEILRDIPLGKGGGKKRAIIDLTSFIDESDDINDLRIFDGDSIYLPKLNQPFSNQLQKSILNGLSPKFIKVNIFGRVENPGAIKLPLEASLSDAINLTGPIKPLSGKIVLIRYNKDGTILNKNISFSSRAKKGSKRNPFVKEGDMISVKNSLLGRSTGIIREFTAPFVGIYSTKELIEGFRD